jgi:hypothetical protein
MRIEMLKVSNKLWIPSAIPFFLFGLIYYLVTPYFSLIFFSDLPLIEAAAPYISLGYFNFFYWLDVLIVFLFFYIGYGVANLIIKPACIFVDKNSHYVLVPGLIFLLLLILYFLVLLKIKLSGQSMFSGYESYNVEVLGPLATLVFTSALFYNFYVRKKIKVLFLFLFLITSVALLGFGSRMFFLLGLIAIVLGSLSRNPYLFRSVKFYIFVVFSFFLVIGVGVWRSGYSLENGGVLVSIFLVEPLFTATSGSLYLENLGQRFVVNFPSDILAAVINFIPSFIFPEKMSVINQMIFDENKQSPFGANALFSNLYSNFGVFYPVYIFLIGFFYGFLRVKSFYSYFFRAAYFSLLPLLMFHFFREGFITFIKVLVFNGMIFPFILLFVAYLIFTRKRTRGVNHAY